MRSRPLAVPVVLAVAVALWGCASDSDPAVDAGAAHVRSGGSGRDDAASVLAAVDRDLTVQVGGADVVPEPGDPDATGRGLVSLHVARSEVCVTLTTERMAEATAAHLHEGVAGDDGPIVSNLAVSPDGRVDGCASADLRVLREIAADPAGYYLDVHSVEHADGAVRGQLD